MSKPMTIEEFTDAEAKLINKKKGLSKYASGAHKEIDTELKKLRESFKKSFKIK